MIVKMISTRYGSADGMRVDEYRKGETYDLRDSLASIFLKEGWAVKVEKALRSTKDAGSATENKTVKSKRTTRRGGHGA